MTTLTMSQQPVHKARTWSRGRSPSPSEAGSQCKGSLGPALLAEPSVPDVEKYYFLFILKTNKLFTEIVSLVEPSQPDVDNLYFLSILKKMIYSNKCLPSNLSRPLKIYFKYFQNCTGPYLQIFTCMPWPCSSCTAANADVGDSKSTKPYPCKEIILIKIPLQLYIYYTPLQGNHHISLSEQIS